jgi:hypothetical protein
LIIILSALVMLPIFIKGFPYGDDAQVHYLWTSEFVKMIGDGALYPRWLAGLNQGRGSPAMIYYPPLPYYVMAAAHTILGSTMRALAFGSWVALALSGVSMYAFSRLLLARWGAFAAAALYMFAPYHLFDLYYRSALSEFWAFAWVPLILYATWRVLKSDDWRAVPLLALSYALMLFTHLLLCFALTLLLVIYVLMITRDWRRMLRVAVALGIGGATAAIFILPVLFERNYVKLNLVLWADYSRLFLYEKLNPVYAPTLFEINHNPPVFTYYADVVATGPLLMLALGTLVVWYKSRKGEQEFWRDNLARATWAITALALLMTTRLSTPIWAAIPQLAYMQFPVRWLVFASGGAALFAAAAFFIKPAITKPRVTGLIVLALLAAAVLVNLILSALIISRAKFNDPEFQKRIEQNIEVDEYFPVWTEGRKWQNPEPAPFSVRRGEASVTPLDGEGNNQSYAITATGPASIRFRPFYFPGWVARIDGRPAEIFPSETGQIQLSVEPGEHALTLDFEDTPPRTVGKIISAVGVVALIAFWYIARSRRPPSTG